MNTLKCKNALIQKDFYEDFVKDSKCSWRKKSSYKKPIKRRIFKLLRKFVKQQTIKDYNERNNSTEN